MAFLNCESKKNYICNTSKGNDCTPQPERYMKSLLYRLVEVEGFVTDKGRGLKVTNGRACLYSDNVYLQQILYFMK